MKPVWKTSVLNFPPKPPEEMSVSSLLEIENCPRCWVLSHAHFPQIWKHTGFPPHLHMASIVGQIIHRSLQFIIKSMSENQCNTLDDHKAVLVLKKLGGLTNIIRTCLGNVVNLYDDNPRFIKNRPHFIGNLEEKIPELRQSLQLILAKLKMPSVFHNRSADKQPRSLEGLPFGSYPEIRLCPEGMGWVGIADLVNVAKDGIEIVDFKTGNFREEHAFQLRVYGYLWSKDRNLNPEGKLADKLTIVYESGVIDIPWQNTGELYSLGEELNQRREVALGAINKEPFLADLMKVAVNGAMFVICVMFIGNCRHLHALPQMEITRKEVLWGFAV